jgi:hypothetical protein
MLKLVQVDHIDEIKRSKRRDGENMELILQFLDSGYEIAEITGWEPEYRNTNSLAATLIFNIDVLRLKDKVRVKIVKQRVFLYRKDLISIAD